MNCVCDESKYIFYFNNDEYIKRGGRYDSLNG